MLKRLSTSSLIPLLLPIVLAATCFAQENPFSPNARAEPVKAEKTSQEPLPSDNAQLKSFRKQLDEIAANYAELVAKNEAYSKEIAEVTKQYKRAELRGLPDEEVQRAFEVMQKEVNNLHQNLKSVMIDNELLKKRIGELQKSENESKLIAEEATENRNAMHQQLLETLLYSEDIALQELAMKHLLECSENVERPPVSLSDSKMLRRLCSLTESKSPKCKSLAALCLWRFKPSSARELGIQFGLKWRPLEYVRGSIRTMRIYDELEQPIDLVYEDCPLWEIIEEFKMNYGIGVRLDPEIDSEQLVTYESIGRPAFQSMSDLLKPMKLGFAIVDDEIRIMKESNPDLVVAATFNVAGLNSLAKIETEDILKILQQSFAETDVKFAKVGNNAISAKTTERTQRQIQEKIASLMPPLW